MINVLSLFDGISCGRVALEKANIEVNKYYSSEIDKYAIKVADANYLDNIKLGNINNWKSWSVDWGTIDLLIGGSPCQGFSFSGKQLNFEDHRSKLFFTYVDILNHIKQFNPNVQFLLENVRMKKEYQDVISEHLNVEPVFINSSLVSAQNRPRLYWCNWFVEQPIDRYVYLKDILEYTDNNCRYDALTLVTKDNVAIKINNSEIGFNISQSRFKWLKSENCIKAFKKGYLSFNKPKANCLTARSDASWNCNYILEPESIRKLTPIECERLQTLPDNYTKVVSDTQRYKQLGNGWTVDVIVHILESNKNLNKG